MKSNSESQIQEGCFFLCFKSKKNPTQIGVRISVKVMDLVTKT